MSQEKAKEGNGTIQKEGVGHVGKGWKIMDEIGILVNLGSSISKQQLNGRKLGLAAVRSSDVTNSGEENGRSRRLSGRCDYRVSDAPSWLSRGYGYGYGL